MIEVHLSVGQYEFVSVQADTQQDLEAQLGGVMAALPLIREVQTTVALGGTAIPAAPAAPAPDPWAVQGPAWGGAAPAAPLAPVYQIPQQAQPAPVQQPGVPAPICPHGPMQFRQAKPDSGKDWKAWFCPTPKDTPGQCKPQFLR